MIISRRNRAIFGGLALFAVSATAVPAFAQSAGDEVRIRKLEAEVRALQRTVFPGGDGKFFEPQITGGQPSTSGNTAPSTTAVTDILVRLDALEGQIASLTAQTEQNSNALLLLTNRVAAVESGGGIAAPTGISTPTPATTTITPTPTPAAPVAVQAAGPTAARLAAVKEITKPQTEDPGDDEYSYGFRLWDAGFYPEAQQQLTMFVEKYPRHSRTTYGRNLLGRAYLDAGNPNDAAPWFLKNYQANKQDARAPDSLLYLGEAMIALKDTNRACIALAEFADTYPALASGRLADQYQANLRKVKCN